jgi:hypothetical protein
MKCAMKGQFWHVFEKDKAQFLHCQIITYTNQPCSCYEGEESYHLLCILFQPFGSTQKLIFLKFIEPTYNNLNNSCIETKDRTSG